LNGGNRGAKAVILSETDKFSGVKEDHRGRVSKRCCVFKVLMASQHHPSGNDCYGKVNVFAAGDEHHGGGIVEIVERQVRPENVGSRRKGRVVI
jgi:hypothetical protein